MKIFYSKKGVEVTSNWPFWIVYAVAVGILGVVIVALANHLVEEASRIPLTLEDEVILASRFYNSEKCFAYQDELGAVQPRVIDASKFTQANMDKCFIENDAELGYAFSLSLEESPTPPMAPIYSFNTFPIKTFNYVEDGYARTVLTEDIFVIYEEQKYKGKLKIRIKDV